MRTTVFLAVVCSVAQLGNAAVQLKVDCGANQAAAPGWEQITHGVSGGTLNSPWGLLTYDTTEFSGTWNGPEGPVYAAMDGVVAGAGTACLDYIHAWDTPDWSGPSIYLSGLPEGIYSVTVFSMEGYGELLDDVFLNNALIGTASDPGVDETNGLTAYNSMSVGGPVSVGPDGLLELEAKTVGYAYGEGRINGFVITPEPATLGLLSLGLLGMLRRRR